jgi:hypothetical protein
MSETSFVRNIGKGDPLKDAHKTLFYVYSRLEEEKTSPQEVREIYTLKNNTVDIAGLKSDLDLALNQRESRIDIVNNRLCCLENKFDRHTIVTSNAITQLDQVVEAIDQREKVRHKKISENLNLMILMLILVIMGVLSILLIQRF